MNKLNVKSELCFLDKAGNYDPDKWQNTSSLKSSFLSFCSQTLPLHYFRNLHAIVLLTNNEIETVFSRFKLYMKIST